MKKAFTTIIIFLGALGLLLFIALGLEASDHPGAFKKLYCEETLDKKIQDAGILAEGTIKSTTITSAGGCVYNILIGEVYRASEPLDSKELEIVENNDAHRYNCKEKGDGYLILIKKNSPKDEQISNLANKSCSKYFIVNPSDRESEFLSIK